MKLPGRGPARRRVRPAPATTRPVPAAPGRRTPARPAAHPVRGRPAAWSTARGWPGRPTLRLPTIGRLPRFTPGRAGALLGILASLGGIYGLAATSAFTFARAEIPELRWSARADVEAAIGIPAGTNLFRITVTPLEERIRSLPGVAAAEVAVALPDTIVIRVTERQPILAWAVGETRYLVDREGVLFALAEPGAVSAADLPLIADSRAASAELAIGDRLDPVDLDAATRLASLLPVDLDSVARELLVSVSDATGFVVGTSPASWIAIFGLYTPSVRTPAIIPEQVRLLRSLLTDREASVAQVILSDAEHGTLIPKASPSVAP